MSWFALHWEIVWEFEAMQRLAQTLRRYRGVPIRIERAISRSEDEYFMKTKDEGSVQRARRFGDLER